MNKRTLVVTSKNPVKIEAALAGFQLMFPELIFEAVPVSVPSGVSDQPLTDEETLAGATNRVQAAQLIHPKADFWVGIEGGVATIQDELAAFAWIVVRSATLEGKARSGTFFLPPAVSDLVRQGVELGEADDRVFGHTNSKQKGGAIGLLTANVLDRKQLYEQAVLLSLVAFRNETLYRKQEV